MKTSFEISWNWRLNHINYNLYLPDTQLITHQSIPTTSVVLVAAWLPTHSPSTSRDHSLSLIAFDIRRVLRPKKQLHHGDSLSLKDRLGHIRNSDIAEIHVLLKDNFGHKRNMQCASECTPADVLCTTADVLCTPADV